METLIAAMNMFARLFGRENSCQDILHEGDVIRSQSQMRPPRRGLVRYFEQRLFVISSFLISIPLLGLLFYSWAFELTETCAILNYSVGGWVVSSWSFSLLNRKARSYAESQVPLLLKPFRDAYYKFHVLFALIIAGLINYSASQCSLFAFQYTWLIFVFPILLLSERGGTRLYVAICAIVLMLVVLNEINSRFGVSIDALAPVLAGAIKFGFILAITAGHHYASRRHIMWQQRSHLVHQTIQKLTRLRKLKVTRLTKFSQQWSLLAEEIATRMKFEKVFILFPDLQKKRLNLIGGYGAEEEKMRSVVIELTEGICGHVYKSRSPHLARFVGKHIEITCQHYKEIKGFESTKSELAVPIMIGGKVFAILDIQSDEYNAFSNEDIEVCWAIAGALALRMELTLKNVADYQDESLVQVLEQSARHIHQRGSFEDLFVDFADKLISDFGAKNVVMYSLAPGTGFPLLPPLLRGRFERRDAMLNNRIRRASVLFKLINLWKNKYFEDTRKSTFFFPDINTNLSKYNLTFPFREKIASTAFLTLGTVFDRTAVVFVNYDKRQIFDDTFQIQIQALANLYAFQLLIMRQRELRESPLFIGAADLHYKSNLSILEFLGRLKSVDLNTKEDFNQFKGLISSELKEVTRQILKAANKRYQMQPDKNDLDRRLFLLVNLLNNVVDKQVVLETAIDSNIFYSGRAVGQAIFAVFSEAILNAIQYSEASRIKVLVVKDSRQITCQVEENGKGFDAERARKDYIANRTDSWKGMQGIYGRLEAMESLFAAFNVGVYSNNDGNGSSVHFEIPLISEAEDE